jgi:capsid assembly protease
MLENLWLGNQSAYDAFATGVPAANEKIRAGMFDNQDEEDKKDQDFSLLQVQGNVGVITINGGLADGRFGAFGAWFGVTGYGDIQEALIRAVKNPAVSAIALDIGSGGGEVAGVHDTARLIAMVDQIKPVATYTGSMMASAALWLGASARRVFVAETAITGSLGILMVHKSYEENLKSNGIKATVIRAGEFKTLANPYENLTEAALDSMKAKANYLYDIFLGFVADQRGMSKTAADTQFGQGREFIGNQAVQAGLVDQVGTFADLVTYLSALPEVQRDNKLKVGTSSVAHAQLGLDNSPQAKGNEMPSLNITQEQLTAMAAAGIAPETEELEQAAPSAETQAPTPVAEPDYKAQAEALTAEIASLKADLAAVKANADAWCPIVRAGLKTMTISLSGTAASVDAIADADLAIKYAEVTAQFKEKYKAGGVSASSKTEDNKPVVQPVNQIFAYAVRNSKK